MVFAKAGTNGDTPYDQQSSGFNVLNSVLWPNTPQLADVANQALQVAFDDAGISCIATTKPFMDLIRKRLKKAKTHRPRRTQTISIKQGSGEVYADLAMADVDEMIVNAQLVVNIDKI